MKKVIGFALFFIAVGMLIMLMLLSILYCSIYSMGISVVSRAGSMLVSYLFLYLIVVVAA